MIEGNPTSQPPGTLARYDAPLDILPCSVVSTSHGSVSNVNIGHLGDERMNDTIPSPERAGSDTGSDLIVVSKGDLIAAITAAIENGVTWELEPYANAISGRLAIDVIRRLDRP